MLYERVDRGRRGSLEHAARQRHVTVHARHHADRFRRRRIVDLIGPEVLMRLGAERVSLAALVAHAHEIFQHFLPRVSAEAAVGQGLADDVRAFFGVHVKRHVRAIFCEVLRRR